MPRLIKVTGSSLSPFFLPGDYVLTGKPGIFVREYQMGDFIVFTHPDLGLLIKTITEVNHTSGTYQVAGTNPDSVDSKTLGEIHKGSIIGKVVWHIKRPDRPFRA